MKRIAIDAKRLFFNDQGLGSYAKTLIHDLCHYFPDYEYYLCTPKYIENRLSESIKAKVKLIVKPRNGIEWYWRQKGLIRQLKENNIDVYFGISNELPRGLREAGIGSVVMIHDLIYKAFPIQFSAIDRMIYQNKFSHAIQTANQIIAASQSTKTDILEYFKIDEAKVKVIYQAVSPKFRIVAESKEQREPSFLVVGSINQRKNLEALVKAYKLLPPENRWPVYCVGIGKKYLVKMKRMIRKLDLEQCFIFSGHLSDAALKQKYLNAKALIFPSQYEGFGLPLLEALYSGLAVIANNNSSIPEVLSNYGIIVECNMSTELKAALLKVQQEDFNLDDASISKHLEKFNPALISAQIIDQLKMTGTLQKR